MKHLPSAAAALAMFGALLPSALAAGFMTAEPNNGFLKGSDPEWSSAHAAVTSWQLPGHRQYHRDAEAAHAAWHAEHASERGTALYNMEHRVIHQDRNMAHRLYHMGLAAESASSSSSSSSSSSVSSSAPASSSSSSSSYAPATRDNVAPTVTDSSPAHQSVNVAVDGNVTATFSERMYPTSITNTTFFLQTSSERIPGTVTLAGNTATFRPSVNLAPNTLYIATVTNGAKDAAGNTVTRDINWSFTTGLTSAAANQALVPLGAAATFGVLAGSTVTNTGPTSITGDAGVSPGTAMTGYPPGVVTQGSMHKADSLAGQAQEALTVAYNDLAARSVSPVAASGNLGGLTLAPGLYRSTSSAEISSGDLTLDAKGDANAMFVFQVATTLNVSAGRRVVLIGGAKASNVYWQVGTSATLEANSAFKGSILADQSISLQSGASVEGRLLARIGGVTLQGNTIVVPN